MTQAGARTGRQAPVALVFGGARSGKSVEAERLAGAAAGGDVLYLATAEARDDEMRQRIAAHQARRASSWSTLETRLDLPQVIAAEARPDRCVLVDCLTLWLSNLFEAEQDVEKAIGALELSLASARGPIVLVSNEIGLGVVPDNALARGFRDAQGALNQRAAHHATLVRFVAVGLGVTMKGEVADWATEETAE